MNPVALILIALAVAVGFLLGHWLIGLIVGLAIVLVASLGPSARL